MHFPWRKFVFSLLALASAGGAAESGAPYVAGFERLQAVGREAQVESGEILLTELSCLACHRAGESTTPPAWKSGPDLRSAGLRLRAAWVHDFIADPAAVKPGTTMPNVVAGAPAAKRAEMAEALTHYVMQQQEPVAKLTFPPGTAEHGRELFETIGCIACHSSIPLVRLGEKYAPGELARFLENPLQVRPAGRMPNLRVQPQEAADLTAYLAPSAAPTEPAFAVDEAKAKRGGELFASLGCATCHSGAESKAKPRSDLKGESGCLAAQPGAGVPHYPLSAPQRSALLAALAQTPQPLAATDAARRLMLQRNCFACHQRGGLGGPSPEIAVHFKSTRDDLGELGRLPPPLDGVGRKLQPWALQAVIHGQALVRRYMQVRMPDFGEAAAAKLAPLFTAADADPKEKPTIAVENPNQVGRNEYGRELVGTSGYACIACHDLHGHPSLGIGAYDLEEMPKRLRPEWVRDFLLKPGAYPTGTRMPEFYPKGKPANPKIGGSNAERQIDHIRVYLTEVDQSLPPEGIVDHAAFELKPAERPLVFRTFIDGAGTHAIAVGFPGGLNAAFDAMNSRWALAWRGRFLDADGTWNQRVAKNEEPLGEAVVPLENVGTLVLAGAQAQYLGYRVEKSGVPVFLYKLGALQVEDRVEPNGQIGLRRTLHLTGQTGESVRFEAKPPKEVIVSLAAGAALPTTLNFQKGAADLVEEIAW